ncbi:MAG TPA: BTAD domain-containing putative transcriptional regulator [Nocardioides sp.]|uniref:BTAD domain-containing putative transcriptional regulator n=1 Tax=Nocardioides sp. TaxID=35761 RepID=UPI002BAE3481|nr:BTAD domain-containing putative transcriptional regulator [Nocardioides sp.]HTW17899.1 BTAD domain-containing putative transcriptional regulator [Nocardioides sp.]
MRIRVLGDVEVEVGAAAVDLGGPKPRALLALLVAADGRAVPVETLIDQIWGDEPPGRVEASLQTYVARLRKALEPERGVRRPADRLRTRAGGYSLDVEAEDVDARRMARLVEEARRSLGDRPDRAAELLVEALELWRGEPYPGLESPSLRAEAVRLTELRLSALEDLWDLRVAAGRHAEAVPELEQLARLHPLRERLWGLLARAQYAAGRQGDALATLRRAREHLAEELGIDPGPELRALEEAVLQQDPALDAPERPGPSPAASAPPSATGDPGPALPGRQAALAAADGVLDAARRGRGGVILVSGEPGIGKTRFAETLVSRAEAAGFRTGRGGWEAEACPPMWGWTRAVERLLGDAGLLDPGPADADAASVGFRQAGALAGVLRDGPPAMLVLDDVHWADVESLRLLRRFAADLAGLPVVLVVAVRSTTADIGEPVADLLAALARLDAHRVELAGLDADAVGAWVAHQTGMTLSAPVTAGLVERTDGNPFHVAELVRLLVSEGALSDPTAPAWRAVPTGVRDVVRQRLTLLEPEAGEVLALAAVAGRSFDLAVVAAAAGLAPERVDEAVESAQMLGLVDEESPERYRFAHALVRDAVRGRLTAAARSRAHARVAAAVERVHAGRIADHLPELAEHYRLAGPAYARSGWVFARKAAERAAAASAHDEAERLLAQAADLQDRDPTTTDPERETVLLGRARALSRIGRPIDAWPLVERAARSALARGDASAAAAALLVITEGLVWGWRAHPQYDDDSVALWEEVCAAQPADEALVRAHLTAATAFELLYRPGAADRATRLSDEAVRLVRATGRRGERELEVLRLAQAALLRPDLLHHRTPLVDEIVEIATAVGDPAPLAGALAGRAQDRFELGRLDAVRSDVVRAHELAERHHLSQQWLVTGWYRTTLALLDEDWDTGERLIAELEAFAATLAMSGGGIETAQLFSLRDGQGRAAELEPALRPLAPYHPAYREVHALALARTGALDELRMLLGPWSEQPALPWDYMWPFLVAVRAEIWVALGDAGAARDLLATLGPYADRLAVTGPVGFRGSMRLHLGELARVAGDDVAARDHLEAARRVHEELGLPLWVARTDATLARLGR